MSQEEQQVTKGLQVEELSLHYLTVHGAPLNPCEYGFLSLSELLKSLPYLVEVSRVCLSFKPPSWKLQVHNLFISTGRIDKIDELGFFCP